MKKNIKTKDNIINENTKNTEKTKNLIIEICFAIVFVILVAISTIVLVKRYDIRREEEIKAKEQEAKQLAFSYVFPFRKGFIKVYLKRHSAILHDTKKQLQKFLQLRFFKLKRGFQNFKYIVFLKRRPCTFKSFVDGDVMSHFFKTGRVDSDILKVHRH